MLQVLVYSLALVPALTLVAVAAGRATAHGERPWLWLAGIWVGVALTVYFAVGRPVDPLPGSLMLLAPLGVTASLVEMEIQRGCSLLWAGSVGVLLGVAVTAALPFLYGYLGLAITCVARGSCF